MVILSFLSNNPQFTQRITEQNWVCHDYNGSIVCRPSKYRYSVFANIVAKNALIPACNHFRKSPPSSLSLRFPSIAKTSEKCFEVYVQSNICQSDVILHEVNLTEKEETVMNLVISLNSVMNCRESRRRLIEMKALYPKVFQNASGIGDIYLTNRIVCLCPAYSLHDFSVPRLEKVCAWTI